MALIPLPTNVGYGTVEGRFILAYSDSADSGQEPDAKPAKGYVIFTASPPKLLDPTAYDSATLAPVTILPAPVTAYLDEDGYIEGYTGNRGVRLVATDDPNINPYDPDPTKQWTWNVQFRLTDESDVPYPLAGFSFRLPEEETVDLAVVSPVPASNGTYYTTGPAGPATVLSVSSTTTGDPGTSASVTISGTAPTQSLAFTIPRGDKGDQGDPGDPGADALWNYLGEYSASIAYDVGDVVTYLGSTYYRTVTAASGFVPTNVSYWEVIALKGETGAAGASIVVKGQVATVGALPATGNTVNDAWIVTSNGHLYVWDGTDWIDAGNVQGPAGEGVPTGGDAHMYLKKTSSTDYDTEWTDTINGGSA